MIRNIYNHILEHKKKFRSDEMLKIEMRSNNNNNNIKNDDDDDNQKQENGNQRYNNILPKNSKKLKLKDLYMDVIKIELSNGNDLEHKNVFYLMEKTNPYYALIRSQKWEGWEMCGKSIRFNLGLNEKSYYQNEIVYVCGDALDSIICLIYKRMMEYNII